MTRKKPLPDDGRFKHVSYHRTNLAATFKRIRKEQENERNNQNGKLGKDIISTSDAASPIL